MRKKILIISVVAGGVLIIASFFLFRKEPSYNLATAERDNLIQEVSVTGTVKPSERVDLSFEKSGRVAWVNAKVGDKVGIGQVLVTLNNNDLTAQLAEAEASVKAQKAKLEELRLGTRPEEIKIQEIKVQNAQVSLEEARKNLVDKIQDAYTKSDDAISGKTDKLFTSPKSSNPQFDFAINDYALKNEVEALRANLEPVLNSWPESLTQLTTRQNLSQVKNFLDKVAIAINSLNPSSTLSQTTLDGYKTDVSTARTNVNTAITNLSTAEEKLKTAEAALVLEENELALDRAGTVAEQIIAQEAKVEEAEASVQNIEAQIAKTIIRAPISGLITKQEGKVGEVVAANTTIVSLISESEYQIEANIPEVDIAKVKISDPASITLDAYGPEVGFEARVVKIDPAETIIEGVATYKTTLQFLRRDDRIKSGMTANIDIQTDKRENVIAIPQRAVISSDGQKTVKVLEGKNIKEVSVKTGLRGSDGNIEILEGINEGDKVIISTTP